MKICNDLKCKRMALGLTQTELAELIGISPATVSQFELGKEVSVPVFNTIKYGIENLMNSMDRKKMLETRIVYLAYSLEYRTDEEKLLSMNYMSMNIAKLNMELLKEQQKPRELY